MDFLTAYSIMNTEFVELKMAAEKTDIPAEELAVLQRKIQALDLILDYAWRYEDNRR